MMELSSWDVLDLAGGPFNPWGELRLIGRLNHEEEPVDEPMAPPASRPALSRAA
jgi:hypothetical protein